MTGKIFINYRRDDSIGMAGRLHDRLAQTFGRDRLFMDVDHIPAGADFVAHLNSQVAECKVVLVVIGRNWLRAKDKAGQRRLHQPDDFVAIEIAAALARDIRVIPVLVDGARMAKESELPDSLKPLARRQAVDVRHSHFGQDAEALVKRMREALGEEVPVPREREALGDEKAGPGRWRVRAAIGAAAVAVLLLIGWGGYELILYMKADIEEAFRDVRQRAELDKQAALEAAVKAQQELQAKHQAEQAEQQRVAGLRAEEDRRAKAAAEAEAKRKADEAEQQRLAAVKAEQEKKPLILGLDLANLTDELRKKYNIKDKVKGVLITGVVPNSLAAEKKLAPGMVIAEVLQQAVATATELQERVEKLKKDGKKAAVLLVMSPDGDPFFVLLPLYL